MIRRSVVAAFGKSPSAGFSATLAATQSASLKAYWKCDEANGTTLVDSSGNSKDLTITGTINTNYWLGESGEQGTCFRTDGSAGYAKRTDSVIGTTLVGVNFTMMLLLKASSVDFSNGVFASAFSINEFAQFYDTIYCGQFPPSTNSYAACEGAPGGGPHAIIDAGTAFNNAWHLWAFRRNGTAYELFIDGTSVGTDTKTINTAGPSALDRTSLMLLDFGGVQYYAKGSIQHAAIWDTNLSDAEIVAINTART